MRKSQITIVGAGIPGMALALILADAGMHVTLVDKFPLRGRKDVKPSSRTAALMQSSLDVLKRAAVWDDGQKISTPLSILSIIDDSAFPNGAGSMIREDFKSSELGLSEFGFNIPLIGMTGLIADKVRDYKNITVMDNIEIDQHHDVIQQADLVVGADGRNSAVREWSNIRADKKDYGQVAMTCVISHDKPHHNNSIEFHRSGGPCTFVPHGEGQSAIVWVEKAADAKRFLDMPEDDFLEALQMRSRGVLGNLKLVLTPESWSLITVKADRLTAQKTALIAEAAHVVSPIGAQGMNMSLRDVGALADVVIKAHCAGRDVGGADVLNAYERNRRRDLAPRMVGIDLFNQFVANDNVVAKHVRRLGLRAIRYAGPLRQFLMQEGLSP